MIEKIKRLFISEAGEHINKQAKEIINTEGELDEQRMKFSSCLQEYYSLKNNRNKTSDLINRLHEISENRSIKSFWLSILTGAVISLVTSVVITIASNSSAEDSGALFVKALYVALGGGLLYTIAAIVVWGAYRHLSPYDRFHSQEQEKELIENILEDRRKGSHNKLLETVGCAAHPTTKP